MVVGLKKFSRIAAVGLDLVQILIFAASMGLAFGLRFDLKIPSDHYGFLVQGVVAAIAIKFLVFRVIGVHQLSWRHVGVNDLMSVLSANLLSSALLVGSLLATVGSHFPRSVYVLDLLLCLLATGGVRLMARVYLEKRRLSAYRSLPVKRILIYGAGDTGVALAREINSNPQLGYKVVGFIDDQDDRRSLSILGVPILGSGRGLASTLAGGSKRTGLKIDEIVVAMPAANSRELAEALANCQAAGVPCKTVPGLGEILAGRSLGTQIRDITMNDLLGRQPVDMEDAGVQEMISHAAVMVTGAAGSIGSEICRQVAMKDPQLLVAFDQSETALFHLENDLRKEYPEAKLVFVLGDIRDKQAVAEVLRTYAIDVIYHAAAYKHVPIVERQPFEAIRNNVLGTWSLANAAYEYGVTKFVMISSDKAVNPSSMMGATKRAAEILLDGMPADRTQFVSVRFGNVLGSNGSVIPLFKKQIAAGGPVTITHPSMQRFFMTIPEAVQLVLCASTMGRRSEVFVLDMGAPVFIVDLAKQLIRLSGLEPGKDIEIRYTGMREGEKLAEELVVTGEKMSPTDHRKIWALRGASADPARNRAWLSRLVKLLELRELDSLRAHMRELIPEFCPPQPISMIGAAMSAETTLGKPARSARAAAVGAGSGARKVS